MQCGIEVHPDGLVVDDLVGDTLGDGHCQQGIGSLLLNGSGRSGLADGGDGYQGRGDGARFSVSVILTLLFSIPVIPPLLFSFKILISSSYL